MTPTHQSAEPNHYDEESEHYDTLNEENSRATNQVVEQVLSQHKVKTVLDFTCGTGSQVFWLSERGFEVVGADINPKMLAIARGKASTTGHEIQFTEADMRTGKLGTFDSVITIFNAIGHLTKSDFELALRNFRDNLNDGGLYVFDIFSLEHLLTGDNISNFTIDWVNKTGDKTIRKVQHSTVSEGGVMASYTTCYTSVGDDDPKVSTHQQTLQIYSAQQLHDLLASNGFEAVSQLDLTGQPFKPKKSDRLLTVARKA